MQALRSTPCLFYARMKKIEYLCFMPVRAVNFDWKINQNSDIYYKKETWYCKDYFLGISQN
jgi:hypothetical protein